MHSVLLIDMCDMVLRERKINCKSDAVQIQVSFGVPDVKDLMKMYAGLMADKDFEHTEKDVRYWLEHDGRAFLSWPEKWKEQLSGWCFATAVRNKLLEPTAVDENRYYLADCLFARRGRPKKDE